MKRSLVPPETTGDGSGPPPRPPSPPCASCGGTGFEATAGPDGVTRVRRCGCLMAGRSERLLRVARVPRRYGGCSFDSYADLNASLALARRKVRKFVDAYPVQEQGLLLLGPCGVGKTHLATAALQTLVRDKGVRGLFYDFRDLLREIQSSYNPVSGVTAMEILQPVFAAEVLVLDDLGATKMTDWVRDTLAHIINNRYNDRRVTIFTSNLEDDPQKAGPDERMRDRPTLEDQIGAPLRSRLDEMCEVIRLEGEDFRRAVKKHGGRHSGRPA
jgi:DNA replication protein DnaC